MPEATTETQKKGLEGIVAGNTSLSFINGQEGFLFYRGYNIHDLVQGSFEEVAYLLLNAKLPTKSELDGFRKELNDAATLPREVIAQIINMPESANPMAALRGAVSSLAFHDAEVDDNSPEANYRKAVRLIAQAPLAVAIFHRARTGGSIYMPNPEWSIAKNFLYMLFGEEPIESKVRLMDAALILHADHGFNASTFTARVIAATLSDMYSAVAGAIGALKGPLHGGANERVMNMLLEVGDTSAAEEWVKNALAEKKKIMGFGHRVYRTEDPRATHLRRMSEDLGRETGETKWFEMSQAIEKLMMDEKGLNPNVDFYSASSYYMMGIPIDLFTPIFAISRMSGWVAHFIEQQADNRLIRPGSNYIGDKDLEYTPIDNR